MHSTRKLAATTMIAAAGAVTAAVALSATAGAQPAAPAPTPGVPGLPFIQQLASNPAMATQLVQGFTSMLNTAATPRRTGRAAADGDRIDHASADSAGTACRNRSDQRSGCARDQPGRPADAGRVAPERSGLVDARGSAVGRSPALGLDTRRICHGHSTRARRTCAPRSGGRSSRGASRPRRGAAADAAVSTALTVAATSTEQTTTTTH